MHKVIRWLFSIVLLLGGQVEAQIMIAKPGDTVMQKSAMLEVKAMTGAFCHQGCLLQKGGQ